MLRKTLLGEALKLFNQSNNRGEVVTNVPLGAAWFAGGHHAGWARGRRMWSSKRSAWGALLRQGDSEGDECSWTFKVT